MSSAAASGEVVAMPSQDVWKFVFKGNYDDLCKKLGQELYEDVAKVTFLLDHISTDLVDQMQTTEGKMLLRQVVADLENFADRLTAEQRVLREACKRMNFENHTARPQWANGAHVFVAASVASEVERMFQPGELNKRHVVVSQELLPAFVAAMQAAGHAYIKEPESVDLPALSKANSALLRGLEKIWLPSCGKLWNSFIEENLVDLFDRVDEVSLSRMTHSTGSLPRGERDKSWGPSAHKAFSLQKMPGKLDLHQLESDVEVAGGDAGESPSQATVTNMSVRSFDFMNPGIAPLRFLDDRFDAASAEDCAGLFHVHELALPLC